MLVPFRSVLSTRPASFVTAGPLDEAVRRLAAVVKRNWLEEWAVDCLLGRVSAGHVEVRRHRAGSRDPLPAVFVGAFSTDADKVILAGHFRHSTASRFLLLWALAAGVFIGAFMIASGLALWRSTQPLTEEDVSVVSAGIQEALDTPSNKPLERPGFAGRSAPSRWAHLP
jgi:hypothetical protein